MQSKPVVRRRRCRLLISRFAPLDDVFAQQRPVGGPVQGQAAQPSGESWPVLARVLPLGDPEEGKGAACRFGINLLVEAELEMMVVIGIFRVRQPGCLKPREIGPEHRPGSVVSGQQRRRQRQTKPLRAIGRAAGGRIAFAPQYRAAFGISLHPGAAHQGQKNLAAFFDRQFGKKARRLFVTDRLQRQPRLVHRDDRIVQGSFEPGVVGGCFLECAWHARARGIGDGFLPEPVYSQGKRAWRSYVPGDSLVRDR